MELRGQIPPHHHREMLPAQQSGEKDCLLDCMKDILLDCMDCKWPCTHTSTPCSTNYSNCHYGAFTESAEKSELKILNTQYNSASEHLTDNFPSEVQAG